MAATTLHTSVSEFLRSRRFSNSIVLLIDENNAGASSSSNTEAAEAQQDQRILENAIRVALLLTRSFVHDLGDEGKDPNRNSYLSSSEINLSDYAIEYEQRDVANGDDEFEEGISEILLLGIQELSTTLFDDLPKKGHRQHHLSRETHMQILGRLLFAVFSQARSLDAIAPPFAREDSASGTSSNGSENSASASSTNTASVHRHRIGPRVRATESTTVSKLVDMKAFPVFICRFLADMIDTDRGDEAESPFSSFQDVIEDLELMMARPHIFLQDLDILHQQRRGHSLFGQVHCGREEEALSIISIADQMQQSLVGGDVPVGVEAVFITGAAGSGKSRLARAVIGTLEGLGWISIKAKFDQRRAHASGGIISSMFDQAVSYVVNMRESKDPASVAYSEQVCKSVLAKCGAFNVRRLTGWLPSLLLLFPDIGTDEDTGMLGKDQLIYPLSSILQAILEPGRFMVICCDDLQFSDQASTSLLGEVLINLGGTEEISHRCMFLGLFRDNEVDDDHPFAIQYAYLQMSTNINTVEIKISGLSREAIADMIMQVFKLPRRVVVGLADVVLKKTTGLTIFVIEFLHSLLRDSIIVYSRKKYCYTWELDRIEFIPTSENVTEMILSNLKHISSESKRVLQILSCFGTQTDMPLLQELENYQGGIISSLKEFADMGILDRAGPIVIFSHDMILQSIYESCELHERLMMHYGIGMHLGKAASSSSQLFFSGNQITSPLISLACDQINFASEYITDEAEKIMFAEWNRLSGEKLLHACDFSAAQYYFACGISFLADDGKNWQTDRELSMGLYQGAVAAAFALGKGDAVTRYVGMVLWHVPFKECLDIQASFIKSLALSDKHEECISQGIILLGKLGFDIPPTPSETDIFGEIVSTASLASEYSTDDIKSLCQEADAETIAIVNIADAVFVSAYATESPILPLVACSIIRHSLKKGICAEAAIFFTAIAGIKVRLQQDLPGAKYWAEVSREIIKSSPNKNKDSELRTELILGLSIDIFFQPLNPSNLFNCYRAAMAVGKIDTALMSLNNAVRYQLLGGYNLALLSKTYEDRLKFTAKHGKYIAKHMALDIVLLSELTGKSTHWASVICRCGISSLDDLKNDNETSKDARWCHRFHLYQMMISFFRKDYLDAEDELVTALGFLISKLPQFMSIYQAFYGGLVTLQVYRQLGDNNRSRLEQAKDSIKNLENWAENSMPAFGNKLLLLQAEYSASIGDHVNAPQQYLDSIIAARAHGLIHELALAQELLGNYYCSINGHEEARESLQLALMYYNQWGAVAVKERLMKHHDLCDSSEANTVDLRLRKTKRACEVVSDLADS